MPLTVNSETSEWWVLNDDVPLLLEDAVHVVDCVRILVGGFNREGVVILVLEVAGFACSPWPGLRPPVRTRSVRKQSQSSLRRPCSGLRIWVAVPPDIVTLAPFTAKAVFGRGATRGGPPLSPDPTEHERGTSLGCVMRACLVQDLGRRRQVQSRRTASPGVDVG